MRPVAICGQLASIEQHIVTRQLYTGSYSIDYVRDYVFAGRTMSAHFRS